MMFRQCPQPKWDLGSFNVFVCQIRKKLFEMFCLFFCSRVFSFKFSSCSLEEFRCVTTWKYLEVTFRQPSQLQSPPLGKRGLGKSRFLDLVRL